MIGATLCSGIGAPECAAPWIDWRWHAEIEAFPAAVHAARFPGSVNLGDMTAPGLVERAAAIALPDIIVAGTPCQAFSVAGTRGSLADARGNLTLLFIRICDAIDDLRRAAGLAPLWIVWENVPGVFSTSDNAFGSFVGGLVGSDAAIDPHRGGGWTDAGVASGPRRCAAWGVLDAQHFGLAQRRQRVFVLARGGAGNLQPADALLPITESLRWHPAPRRGAGQRVARPIAAGSPGGSGYRNDADTADNLIPLGLGDDGQLARALNGCKTAAGRHDVSVDTFVAHILRAEGFDASEDGTGRGTPIVPVSAALRGREEGSSAELGDDKAFSLRASSGGGDKPHVLAHAFDARQSDVIQYGDRAGPIDTAGNSQAVAFSAKDYGADAGDLAPTMRAMGHRGSRANAGGQLALAFTQNSRSEVRYIGGDGAVTGAVTSEPGAQQQTYVAIDAYNQTTSDMAQTLCSRGNSPGGNAHLVPAVHVAMQVRRLTPRECERLQGFPDDWTLVEWRGKPAADGPRYKAIGNSMAVPVMRYLLERITDVEISSKRQDSRSRSNG